MVITDPQDAIMDSKTDLILFSDRKIPLAEELARRIDSP